MLNTPQLEALENGQKKEAETREPEVERKCCMKGYTRFESGFRVETFQYMSDCIHIHDPCFMVTLPRTTHLGLHTTALVYLPFQCTYSCSRIGIEHEESNRKLGTYNNQIQLAICRN